MNIGVLLVVAAFERDLRSYSYAIGLQVTRKSILLNWLGRQDRHAKMLTI